MSLFKRINDNIRANLNALLDKAEDPVILLNQYLLDMGDDIVDAENAVARQLVVVHKLKRLYEEAAALADKRSDQALMALQKEREDLAREALKEKNLYVSRASDYKQQYDHMAEIADSLKIQLQEMKDEFERLKARRDTLAARAQAAKAQKNVADSSRGFVKDSSRGGFERMEAKVLQMEAEAQIAAGDLSGGRSVDQELEALGAGDAIERELAELKAKLEAGE